jgi:thiamine kinase-like enzyme
MPHSALEGLGFFQAPYTIDIIHGGMTNQNFRIEDKRGVFFVRRGESLPHLGILRSNELLCHQSAANLGLSPAIVYTQGAWVVSQWIEGQSLSPESLCESNRLEAVAKLLARLHQGAHEVAGEFTYFCVFQTIATYLSRAKQLNASMPDELEKQSQQLLTLSKDRHPFHPKLCHNDLLPANIIDDGQRLWLVDWEYAGMGSSLFDVAGFCVNAQLKPADEKRFLLALRLSQDASLSQDLNLLKAAGLLREVLWAVIQTKKATLKIDYAAYIEENWALYMKLYGK